MTKLLTVDGFKAAAKDGARPECAVMRATTADPEIGEDRTVTFVFSDGSVDRMGDTIDPSGWELDQFNRNSVALWAHDSSMPPIGRASNVHVSKGKLIGDIEFVTPEISRFGDSVYQMVKSGFIKAVSVGFLPLEWSFVNEKDRPFGIDFKKQELLEISVCSIPANPNALSEARAKGIDTAPLMEWAEKLLDEGGSVMVPRALLEETFKAAKTPRTTRQKYLGQKADGEEWKCGAARDLPIDDSDGWDGDAAEASIFEYAGGDDFDPAKARRGFLLYDAAAPKLRGSYKEPFAHVVNGELKAAPGGIRAAASRLPQTDVPQSVKDTARSVLDGYEAKMKDGKDAAPIVTKAGRKISAANAERLNKAIEHIQAVLGVNDPDDDGDNDTPGSGGDTDNDGGKSAPDPIATLRESAKKTLAETRDAQERDLTI